MIAAPPVPETVPAGLAEAMVRDAHAWAVESGFEPPLAVQPPEIVAYPMRGHGYSVAVSETAGGGRIATARFDASGRTVMWTVDGGAGTC